MRTNTKQTTATETRARGARQRGSILILTLFAVGMIAGAYLYIGVIGSRSAETTRARTSGDATAMAAAIVKARTLNYEAFLLLAESVFLPLGQVTENIVKAQTASFVVIHACPACIAACEVCALCPQCIAYSIQMATTAAKQPAVNAKVNRWLEGLSDMAQALDTVAPYWAENSAMKVGTDDAYKGPGQNGVHMAASFPLPDSQCGQLGVEMIDNNKPHGPEKRDACHDLKELEYTFLYMKGKPAWMTEWNIEGYTLIFKSLTLGAKCDKTYKQPSLRGDGKDWKSGKYRYSRGMALEQNPNDHWQQSYLEALRETKPPKMLGTGYLLGMGCAEHYSQDHYDEPSLWSMDWRARLVPCDYEKGASVSEVTQCGSGFYPPYAPIIQLQFRNQERLNIAKHWKW